MSDTPSAGGPAAVCAAVPPPPARRLQVYAFDPSLATRLETAVLNRAVLRLPWEPVQPGPVGEYLEVVDVDPASGLVYPPVDLDHPLLLARDGLDPAEGVPQFHQQMVYAVAMTTIRNFERALGRRALWTAHRVLKQGTTEVEREEYVPRLRLYPHALRQANAYYSPEKVALLFGYFPATADAPGEVLPGGTVFACLSHDVIAHETTHALLDGMHRRFIEASNPDVLAFHEAFADLVALFQHFTLPEVLRHQIARTRGDLRRQSLLGQLAQQFGQAIGQYGALRDAIGGLNPQTGEWEPKQPDPAELERTFEPHARGSILVAAVFDAFLSIYQTRVADLLRIATSGTGLLPQGDLHPDLVNRLADEAAKAAQHVLNMCIRALDYCPPVDLTFGEYLRALITADYELVPDDDRCYRVAFVEAFRRRGIYPHDLRTLSVDSLVWLAPSPTAAAQEVPVAEGATELAQAWSMQGCRERIWQLAAQHRAELHQRIAAMAPEVRAALGLDTEPATFEVHSLRPARRVGPDGEMRVDYVVELTQRRWEPMKELPDGGFWFRGGSTLLVDAETQRIRYTIYKSLNDTVRRERQRQYLTGDATPSLQALYFGGPERHGDEPFAFVHSSQEGVPS